LLGKSHAVEKKWRGKGMEKGAVKKKKRQISFAAIKKGADRARRRRGEKS